MRAVAAKDCTFSALLITCINPTRCVGLLTALRFQRADGVCYSWEFVHTHLGKTPRSVGYLHVARGAAWCRPARMKSAPKACRCSDNAHKLYDINHKFTKAARCGAFLIYLLADSSATLHCRLTWARSRWGRIASCCVP